MRCCSPTCCSPTQPHKDHKYRDLFPSKSSLVTQNLYCVMFKWCVGVFFINVLSNLLVRGISTYNFFTSNKCYFINTKLNQICTASGANRLCPSSSRAEQGGQPQCHESCEARRTSVSWTERNLASNVPCGLHAHPDSYHRLDTGVSVFLDYFNI